MSSPPVDLSFQDLHCLAAATLRLPNSSLQPIRINSKRKYMSRSIRLSYNKITDLTGLQDVINHFLAAPSKIAWLDLSFNQITCIDPILCELRELRMLYFHANAVWSLQEVNNLRQLPHLHTITLHGNPMEMVTGYRKHVICALPQLKKMDFSAVTRDERLMANVGTHCSKTGSAETVVC